MDRVGCDCLLLMFRVICEMGFPVLNWPVKQKLRVMLSQTSVHLLRLTNNWNCWLNILTFTLSSCSQVMQWSQQHIQISRCLCPSLVCPGSLPSALQLRWLWFPTWPALPKRPRLPRSALWRAWQPPRVALRWGAMTVRVRARARHLMLRASPHCHRTRSVPSFWLKVDVQYLCFHI